MNPKDNTLSQSIEIPVCPFCDGKVLYKNWVTHKIFQLECKNCYAQWRSTIDKTPDKKQYICLIKTNKEGKGEKLLNQQHTITFWQEKIRERIPF